MRLSTPNNMHTQITIQTPADLRKMSTILALLGQTEQAEKELIEEEKDAQEKVMGRGYNVEETEEEE